MACAFCATGEVGLVRNLTAGEIVEQIRHCRRELALRNQRVSHVLYMGMGEPFKSYDATLASVRSLIDPEEFGISPRRLTISTCGIVPGIDALGEKGSRSTSRSRCTRRTIRRVHGSCRSIASGASRKSSPQQGAYVKRPNAASRFEYVLLAGVNDSVEMARSLAPRSRVTVPRRMRT